MPIMPEGQIWAFEEKGAALLTTESRIEAANEEMAAIADRAGDANRRVRLRAVWQPIAFDLIDKSYSIAEHPPERLTSDPSFVGITCDTRRLVFLERQTSASGFVYRKFMVRDPRIMA